MRLEAVEQVLWPKMNKLTKRALGAATGTMLLCGICTSVNAVSVTVDTILADEPTGLSATVDMTLSGSQLVITVVNTSTTPPVGANGLLTGLAFALPNGCDIVSGTVLVAGGSTVIGNINSIPGGNNVSGEWGFSNARSGHFNDANLAVNTQVSTMSADAGTLFSNTPIDGPAGLTGPDYGVLATGGDPGGLAAIRKNSGVSHRPGDRGRDIRFTFGCPRCSYHLHAAWNGFPQLRGSATKTPQVIKDSLKGGRPWLAAFLFLDCASPPALLLACSAEGLSPRRHAAACKRKAAEDCRTPGRFAFIKVRGNPTGF